MKVFLKTMNLLMYIIVLIAAVNAAYAIVGFQMVHSGYAVPGEPMYLDELAPPISESITAFFVSLSAIVASAVTSFFITRRLKNAI